MKQAILLILLSLFASFMTYAQPTHGVSFQLGLINNIYKSAVPVRPIHHGGDGEKVGRGRRHQLGRYA